MTSECGHYINKLSTDFLSTPAAIATITTSVTPHAFCTHIYPLQVTVGLRRWNHGVIGVDDGHDVHAQQLLQRAVQVLPLFVIMEIQIRHQDLTAGESRELTERSK